MSRRRRILYMHMQSYYDVDMQGPYNKLAVMASHQLREHGEQQRRGENSRDENALLVEVRLARKALPVLPQKAVDAPCIVHQGRCTTACRPASLPS